MKRQTALILALVGVALVGTSIAAANSGSDLTVIPALIGSPLLLIALLVWASKRRPEPAKEFCTRCGTIAAPDFYGRGSGFVCLLLCLLFLVPGIIYFIWMKSTEYWGCARCQARETVPLDSPVAQRALNCDHPEQTFTHA